MADIPPINCSHTYLLLSIAFSHYVEKARWAFAYYRVPYAQHLLLPALHIFTVKPIVDSNVCTHEKRDTRASPWSTPCLVVYDASGSKLQESFHDSHDILMYLSENFSTPDHVNLYTSCGLAKADEIKALERRYDEGLGAAAIDFFYLDAVVFNKWRSMLPFALMGFKNKVGSLQSLIWFVFSPLIGKMILSAMSITASKYQKAMHTCREEFRHASELLGKSEYLAGSRLSAADITFAALSYPFLRITHQEGFQQYPLSSLGTSSIGKAFQQELRATKAGQHVLRLYKEERYFESYLPRQKKTLVGLW